MKLRGSEWRKGGEEEGWREERKRGRQINKERTRGRAKLFVFFVFNMFVVYSHLLRPCACVCKLCVYVAK